MTINTQLSTMTCLVYLRASHVTAAPPVKWQHALLTLEETLDSALSRDEISNRRSLLKWVERVFA